MLQWLVDAARGRDARTDKLVTRMLFLNAAAIHTTAEVATNVILDLCAHPMEMEVLKEEIEEVMDGHDEINMTVLSGMKKMDSFIKESHRMSTLGLMTFNRQLAVPVTLSNSVVLPKNTYISMTHYMTNKDPSIYASPHTFDPLRFYHLCQNPGDEPKHQFASLSAENPSWGAGKFASPGRFWASAQIKLVLMVLLKEFEFEFSEGQVQRPENGTRGEKNQVSGGQRVVFREVV